MTTDKLHNDSQQITVGETKDTEEQAERPDVGRFIHKFHSRDRRRKNKPRKMRRR